MTVKFYEKKLIFGNPDHIEKAREGQICECGHEYGGHNKEGDCYMADSEGDPVVCRCECGHSSHLSPPTCKCENFTPKK